MLNYYKPSLSKIQPRERVAATDSLLNLHLFMVYISKPHIPKYRDAYERKIFFYENHYIFIFITVIFFYYNFVTTLVVSI